MNGLAWCEGRWKAYELPEEDSIVDRWNARSSWLCFIVFLLDVTIVRLGKERAIEEMAPSDLLVVAECA